MRPRLAAALTLAVVMTACSGAEEGATPATTAARTDTPAAPLPDGSTDPGDDGEKPAARGSDNSGGGEPEDGIAKVAMSDQGIAVLDVAMSGRDSVQARPEGVAADGGGDVVERVFVEIKGRRASGGGVEVGLRVNATTTEWLPQERVFDYETVPAGTWWSSSPAGSGDGGVSAVRVRARQLDDGRIEMGLTTPSISEVLPRARFVSPEELAGGGWFHTSPVVLGVAGDPAPTAADDGMEGEGFAFVSVGHSPAWRWGESATRVGFVQMGRSSVGGTTGMIRPHPRQGRSQLSTPGGLTPAAFAQRAT